MLKAAILACALTALAACHDQASGGGAGSRDQIRIVGSSTVYPFTTVVAEHFLNGAPGMRAPVIESTGTGAGMKLFCAGIGAAHPDIEDASRRMKAAEYASCRKNGARDILEIEVGLDGIAFAESKAGAKLRLGATDLYRALAARPDGQPNAARTWHDVNAALPGVPIQIYGPPATSGTRDALAELILTKGCLALRPQLTAVRDRDAAAFAAACTAIREDGAYIDAGENDNLIVQKLQSNTNAIGIFGYSYLEENRDRVDGVAIDGIAPTYPAIADGSYPGSRPLFLYVKKAHLNAVPGLRQFLATYAADWSAGGPLTARGLIAAPLAILARSAAIIRGETPLDPATLK